MEFTHQVTQNLVMQQPLMITLMSPWRKNHALSSSSRWECQCLLTEIRKNPITSDMFSALICWLKVGSVQRLERSTKSRIPIWHWKMIFQDLTFASQAIDYIKKYLGAPTGRDLKIFKIPNMWHKYHNDIVALPTKSRHSYVKRGKWWQPFTAAAGEREVSFDIQKLRTRAGHFDFRNS